MRIAARPQHSKDGGVSFRGTGRPGCPLEVVVRGRARVRRVEQGPIVYTVAKKDGMPCYARARHGAHIVLHVPLDQLRSCREGTPLLTGVDGGTHAPTGEPVTRYTIRGIIVRVSPFMLLIKPDGDQHLVDRLEIRKLPPHVDASVPYGSQLASPTYVERSDEVYASPTDRARDATGRPIMRLSPVPEGRRDTSRHPVPEGRRDTSSRPVPEGRRDKHDTTVTQEREPRAERHEAADSRAERHEATDPRAEKRARQDRSGPDAQRARQERPVFTTRYVPRRVGNGGPRMSLETPYDGITFASRLEARHARLYDLTGTEYQYEPLEIDLPGLGTVTNKYTIDFVVRGVTVIDGGQTVRNATVLVEVKPRRPEALSFRRCMLISRAVTIDLGDGGGDARPVYAVIAAGKFGDGMAYVHTDKARGYGFCEEVTLTGYRGGRRIRGDGGFALGEEGELCFAFDESPESLVRMQGRRMYVDTIRSVGKYRFS